MYYDEEFKQFAVAFGLGVVGGALFIAMLWIPMAKDAHEEKEEICKQAYSQAHTEVDTLKLRVKGCPEKFFYIQ